jgi:hypothetical protein
VALLYGCITACVRAALDVVIRELGPEGVIALVHDCLWITEVGRAKMRGLLLSPDAPVPQWKEKDVYERVWMDGAGRAVVERGGKRYAHLAGIPVNQPAAEGGRVQWRTADDWTADKKPTSRRGVGVRFSGFDARRFVRDNDFAARAHTPFMRLTDGLLLEELLLPRQRERRVDDDE